MKRRRSRSIAALMIAALIAVSLVAVVVPTTVTAAPAPCRVRNLTQNTSGPSLIRMVARAVDGDELRVGGRCPGEVVIDDDVVIAGAGDGASLWGRDRGRVVLVERGTRVTLRRLTIEGGGHVGIRADGVLTVSDSTVRDNGVGIKAKGPDGRLHLVRSRVRHNRRAGIRLTGPRARLIDSSVAANGGPGIASSGKVGLVRSAVRRNGDAGLRPIAYYGQYRLTDSTIASNAGTGVTTREGFLIAVRSTIVRNGDGGISAFGGEEAPFVFLRRSTVAANTTVRNGGGISIGGGFTPAHLKLIRSVVRDNTAADRGGGIAAIDTYISLVDSLVTGNSAGVEGGGIFAWLLPRDVSLDADSSVTDNTPDDCVGTPAC